VSAAAYCAALAACEHPAKRSVCTDGLFTLAVVL
jgi:hypothetical protein